MELFFYFSLLVLLTYASGLFSASEIALFSLPHTKVKTYQTAKEPRKRLVAELLASPRDLLVTVFMMNTLVNILLQNVTSSLFGDQASLWIKIVVPLLLVLIVGEVIPKYFALHYNVTLSLKFAPTIQFFTTLLRPIREWTVKVTTPISRLLFFFLKKEQPISKEELDHVLEASLQSAILSRDEVDLIHGYINLQESTIKDYMQPREDVLFYNMSEPLSKLTYLFVDQACTRIPVCQGSLDSVLGIITASDFFLHRDELKEANDLLTRINKPLFLPETTPARLLLRRFEEPSGKVALIVDERRSIVGLISQEDVVEEVVGEIADKRDQVPLYEQPNPHTLIANAKMELWELDEIWGIKLTSDHDMKTIGGWLTEQIGDIPRPGTKYETNNLLFQVLSTEPNRVKRIYILKKRRRNQ